jgi:hypothetical protein
MPVVIGLALAVGFASTALAFTGEPLTQEMLHPSPYVRPASFPAEYTYIAIYALVIIGLLLAAWQGWRTLHDSPEQQSSQTTRKVILQYTIAGFLFGSVVIFLLSELT